MPFGKCHVYKHIVEYSGQAKGWYAIIWEDDLFFPVGSKIVH
jgi:hypothetical protein